MRVPLVALLLAVLAAACAGASSPSPGSPALPGLAPSEPFGQAQVSLRAPDGTEVEVPVYVAADTFTRSRGLMGRADLPAGTGMLFLFGAEQRGGFWMKDTLIPLSIAFLGSDGQVRQVLDMSPCTADPCPIYYPDVTYTAALEVNRGFFDEVGLDTSWTVQLPEDLD